MEDLKLLCAIIRWAHDFLHHAGTITELQARLFEDLEHVQAFLLKRYEPGAMKVVYGRTTEMKGKKRKWHNLVVLLTSPPIFRLTIFDSTTLPSRDVNGERIIL